MKESDNWAKDAVKDWIKMQTELESAKKTSGNPHYGSEYSDLTEIFRVGKKALLTNNFCFAQFPNVSDRGVTVETKIWHTSGAWILSDSLTLRPADQSPQKIGSCVTYGKRYDFAATLGIETLDDDGNAAGDINHKRPNPAPINAPAAKKTYSSTTGYDVTKDTRPPTEAQMGRLFAIAKSSNWSEADIKQYMNDVYNIQSFNSLNRVQYNELCDLVKEPKQNETSDDNQIPLELPY